MRTQSLFRIVSLFIVMITFSVIHTTVAKEANAAETYSIQIGAFSVQQNVDAALKKLAVNSITGKSSQNKNGST